jgi:hypothetical protein
LRYIVYLYGIRVPLICGAILGAFGPLALGSGLRSLLSGMFDLDYAGVFWVSLLAFLLAGVLTITTELVLRYGRLRFFAPPLPEAWRRPVIDTRKLDVSRIAAVFFALYLACALVLIGSVLRAARGEFVWRLLCATGAAAAALALVGGAVALWSRLPEEMPHLARLLRKDPYGYLWSHPGKDGQWVFEDRVLRGHSFAAFFLGVCLVLYVALGVSRLMYLRDASAGLRLPIPTLGSVLLLIMLICWGLAGLAFKFDRFRIPILGVLAALFFLTAQSPWSDHFYDARPRADRGAITPEQVLRATALQPADGAILVAASGGGIQAGAWTAKVLAGLAEACERVPAIVGPDTFAKSVRVISSVSGGSAGALYFVAAYQNGRLALPDLDRQVVEPARASSLDDIAWGLVYPDLIRSIVPVLRDIDRGWATERAWSRFGALPARLSEWREEVRRGRRPAVIFNGTVVETGGRFVMSTVDFTLARRGAETSFHELYPDHDLPAVSAARLSATFPYVSPVARITADVPEGKAYHIADGGYYDNYGIASISELLEQAFRTPFMKRVMLIVIDGGDEGFAAAATSRGWFFQALAPLNTLLSMRTTAQRSRNATELRLLRETLAARGVCLDVVPFPYRGGEHPLSWHLTQREKDSIDRAWNEHMRDEIEQVKKFVGGLGKLAPCSPTI